ncbi:MAG: DUF190 domain-containing protein [Planctomycetota bacterium]
MTDTRPHVGPDQHYTRKCRRDGRCGHGGGVRSLCHERGIAGATVFRAMEGYGSSGHIHTTRLLELGENLPVRIEAILPLLDGMIAQGLVTLSDVQVRQYKSPPPH